MKRRLLTGCLLLLCLVCFGQGKLSKRAAAIVEEGKMLYRSEMASWHGSDIFLERLATRVDKCGGYVSYPTSEGATCLFYSKSETLKVICAVSFDRSYSVMTALVDSMERDLSPMEFELIELRNSAKKVLQTDTLFKVYENTGLNLIPVIVKGKKKVYVLTGPKKSGTVYIGNDYLLTFNVKNKLTSKKMLHRNVIPINFSDQEGAITMHAHLSETGYLITPTDICTLMLYANMAKWKQHYVISSKYVSVWDCESNQLVTLTRKVWDKMSRSTKQK